MGRIGTETSVRELSGIGAQRAAALGKLGIVTVGDLLRHFPRGYQNRGDVRLLRETSEGETASFVLTVSTMPVTARLKSRMTLTRFTAVDDEGTRCVISYFNQSYLQSRFAVGMKFRFYGRLGRKNDRYTLASPVSEICGNPASLPSFYPVYPLTAGLHQRFLKECISSLIARLPELSIADPLPPEILEEQKLAPLSEAFRMVHCPQNFDEVQRGRSRFMFEQIFTFALGVSMAKRCANVGNAPRMTVTAAAYDAFLAALPYQLTGAQARAVSEIRRDLCGLSEESTENKVPYRDAQMQDVCAAEEARGTGNSCRTVTVSRAKDEDRTGNICRPIGTCRPMNRMLSGDVGSGKTVCAAAALYFAAVSGRQSALMAPTEILAQQHYQDLAPLFAALGIACALLTGSTKAAEKREIRARLAAGTLPIVIGTHALLSEGVVFADLGLTVTDEQHRFGVMQRAVLARRAEEANAAVPHILVMSATPIPRSLMLVMYGDLSLSVLDELPPGRQHIDTCVVDESYRSKINGFIRRQIREGHQVYVVCPAIGGEDEEEADGALVSFTADTAVRQTSEDRPPKQVLSHVEALQAAFPEQRVACLHGRMKSGEKEAVMQAFAAGEISILVSTTVIEVGVNVPNATLMVVENAERFGLSQLHQLRGRVGRGKAKSYCVLVSDSKGETAQARLAAMRDTNDGYRIAEKDLALRGPGDFFPSASGEAQQHGRFALAGLCDDLELLHRVFSMTDKLLSDDPQLNEPAHRQLRRAVEALYSAQTGTMN